MSLDDIIMLAIWKQYNYINVFSLSQIKKIIENFHTKTEPNRLLNIRMCKHLSMHVQYPQCNRHRLNDSTFMAYPMRWIPLRTCQSFQQFHGLKSFSFPSHWTIRTDNISKDFHQQKYFINILCYPILVICMKSIYKR